IALNRSHAEAVCRCPAAPKAAVEYQYADPSLCAEGAARAASGHRRADKRDELAAFHSITSPARAISVGGSARLITWAVVRLQNCCRASVASIRRVLRTVHCLTACTVGVGTRHQRPCNLAGAIRAARDFSRGRAAP